MSKVRLEKENTRNPMLFSTSVENLFISELLPAAPGDFVKVYLLGLMNAEYGIRQDRASTVNILNMTTEEIDSAWAYWEEKGAVRRVYDAEIHAYRIQFISQIEELYAGPSEDGYEGKHAANQDKHGNADSDAGNHNTSMPGKSDAAGTPFAADAGINMDANAAPSPAYPASTHPGELPNEGAGIAPTSPNHRAEADATDRDEMDELERLEELEISALYEQVMEAKGGTISPREMTRIRDAIKIYGVNPDVYSYAIKYCREKEKYDVNYITHVAINWKEKGCDDIVQVKNLLDKESQRNAEYRSIFQAVGFNRAWTPADRELMNTWLDDWEFSMKDILEACRKTAGMRDPDLRYVNRVLENKMKEAGGIDTRKDASGGAGKSKSSDSYQRSVSKRVLGAYYEYLRNEAEIEYQNHLETAKKEIPAMAELLNRENELNKAIMMSFSFNSKAKEERQKQMQRRQDLNIQKRALLQEYGYPEDYLEKKFKCSKCKDTGITDDGQYCTCTKERVNEAYKWNLKRTK